ncbi:ribonuclease HII [Candidatus Kaiserbacteria bacterium]|nr:ribonuclease HII [Candidatus Kaiserbacteria bacterium]MCB9811747.1 ribonuclease HII [Candidatus Nomurabacteria bacterium]
MVKKIRYIVGVDEVGRGPLAGPVAVGAVCVPLDFDWDLLKGVTDSKKLTEQKREELYRAAASMRRSGAIQWSVAMVSAADIDKQGIVPCIHTALKRSLHRATNSTIYRTNENGDKNNRYITINRNINTCYSDVIVKLDGGLKAPAEFINQETIIKGDSKEKVIGLASIVAKVTRDRYMVSLGKQAEFSAYGFATHKGYGTKAHRQAIAEYGLSPQHRRSFCRNLRRGK